MILPQQLQEDALPVWEIISDLHTLPINKRAAVLRAALDETQWAKILSDDDQTEMVQELILSQSATDLYQWRVTAQCWQDNFPAMQSLAQSVKVDEDEYIEVPRP